MAGPNQAELISAITDAARKAFSSLFKTHPGNYYYCSLITTGEARPPVLAAWSVEALTAAAKATAKDPERTRELFRWSYADSPFYCHGEEFFNEVVRLFDMRPRMTPEMTSEIWEAEYQVRLGAMEAAMASLDKEGMFGAGAQRLKTVVLVEVMPPDRTNTERAKRLNPPEALRLWLQEVAEN
jgi:predicted Zn-dependent protease